jgi:RNA polymerase sigma-70 factor (ECF subfamily)
MEQSKDAAAVAAVLAGNVDAFAVIIDRYRDAFTRYAVRMLGSREDADDALQSAFVRAFRHLDRCRNPDRLGAWLYQIVINECRTLAVRRGRRDLRLVRDERELDGLVAEQGEADLPLRARIEAAVAQLEPGQREAFILKHVEELSYEQMRQITGVGEAALKMRVKRARDRLKELLQGVRHE